MVPSLSRRAGGVNPLSFLRVIVLTCIFSVITTVSTSGSVTPHLLAQEPVSASEQEATKILETTDNPDKPLDEIRQDERNEEKRRFAEVGMMLLSGIVILGIFLLAIALVLGRRYRRIARSGPPRTGAPDPFWYLKDPGHNHISHRKDDDDGDGGGHGGSGGSHDVGDL